jgi:ribonuclease BN (tRNA processing enzyme)
MSYKEALRAVPITPNEPTDIAGLTATFIPVRHPIPTYGVILRPSKAPAVGSLLFYTADTEWMDELPGLVGDCEILVAEASLTAKQGVLGPKVGHMTAGEAARLGGMTNARTIVLTHYPPGRREEDILHEAKRVLARPVLVATEGLRVEWP